MRPLVSFHLLGVTAVFLWNEIQIYHFCKTQAKGDYSENPHNMLACSHRNSSSVVNSFKTDFCLYLSFFSLTLLFLSFNSVFLADMTGNLSCFCHFVGQCSV